MAGGTAITITGTNLVNVFLVTVGGEVLFNRRVVSSTQITGLTPASVGGGIVGISISSWSHGSGACDACFTYNPPVAVTSVSPTSGPTMGGTPVTITGYFPTPVDSVLVGTGRLSNLAQWSETVLWGTTPAGGGAVAVDVTAYATASGSASCAGCFTFVLTSGFARYMVTLLGTGFDSSRAVDINDSGSVVGQSWSAGSGWRGRLWASDGAVTDLGELLPAAINNAGVVIGRLSSGTDTMPALWEGGAVTPLGGLDTLFWEPGVHPCCGPPPLDARHMYPTDINDRREVALRPGFLWRNDSLVALAGDVYLHGGPSAIGRMNRGGEVAASCYREDIQACAVTTSTVRYVGGRNTDATALNNAGRAIGIATSLGSSGSGTLFGCCSLTFIPTSLNDSLQVVGEGSIWQDSVTASLTALSVDPAWQISAASAINERGQIAAYGINSVTGKRGAIRLDPVASAPGSATVRRR
jgi:hypothetical protein